MDNLPYQIDSKESITKYAKKLKNKTFKEILLNDPNICDENKAMLIEFYNNSKSKGSLGNLIEEHYFYYKPNNNKDSDFNKAGIELKVTPYVINKNKNIRSKERLVLTMIDYMNDWKYRFEDSHLYEKCRLMLLIFYLYDQTKERLDYFINYVELFEIPKSDIEIIKNDYNTILDKIKNGKAHEISEGDTNYLGACTKGANKESVKKQPFSNLVAPQRAFCLKQSYMTYILNNYIIKRDNRSEPIIKDPSILKTTSLENYITKKLSKYYGEDVQFLKEKFKIPYSISNKSFTYLLAKNMLEVLNEKIEEFEKANIKIKAIRLDKYGNPKEAMSFPAFKYTQIINETWEESKLYKTFSTTKYLFIIYQYTDDNTLIFKNSMFWNVPYSDLNTEIKRVWNITVNKVKNNDYNNLPKSSQSKIIHVRPHANNSKDTYPTPDGNKAIKRCFWLNKEYIAKQIKSED